MMVFKINDKEFRELYDKLKAEYPETFQWVREKAKWQCVTIGTVFFYYRDQIEKRMKMEDAEHG